MDAVTSEVAPVPVDEGKDLSAVALGSKGGKKDDSASAAGLTSERRKETAQQTVGAC